MFCKDDGTLYFASCQVVNWWLTAGKRKAVLLRGSTLVRRHLETGLFNFRQEIRYSLAVQKVGAHQSRAEVDSGRLPHHAWLGNSKADELTLYAVAPGDVHAHGPAWDKATILPIS